MSSSRALRDVTNRNNGSYEASAVGEVNVVDLMKRTMPL
jgi:phosphomannomutase